VDALLYAVLSNAAVAAVLAVMVTVIGRISRRPALVHSLWILVLLKLLTPPLWPVSISWLVRSQEGQIMTESPPVEPAVMPQLVDTVGPLVVREERAIRAPKEPTASGASVPEFAEPRAVVPEVAPAAVPWALPQPSISEAAAPFRQLSWQAWLVTIWLAGSACWLALAGYRLYRFHRLLRFTQRAPGQVHERAQRLAKRLGLRRCPGVWVVPAPISPLVWALGGEPRLVVPAALLERLTEEQWDTLLAHELAHLRRRDHCVRILELACLGLYWWHPAVWWARRQLREVEEQCCDAWVVWALPGAAETYATALVEAVTYLAGARSALPLAASGIGAMRLLKRRLNMIMRGTTPRSLSAAGSLAVLGLAAFLLPWCPILAQTEQGAGTGNERAAGGGTTSVGRFQGGETAAPSVRTQVQGQAASGLAAPASDAAGGSRGSRRSQPAGFFGGFSEGTTRPETVEDAQDELDLLRIQLEMREAERREVQARLNEAKRLQQRVARVAGSAGATQELVEHAKTEVEVQEARLLGKEAQIQEAQLRLKQAQRRLTRLREQTPRASERSRRAVYGPAGAQGMTANPASGPTVPSGIGGMRASSFSGGTSFSGSASFGGGPGFGSGTGFGAGMRAGGPGPLASYEHRLAEVEKKLQTLIDEVKALRQQRSPENSPLKP
jgi:beta-lactamase regulating signal transducer with metallopeptidase domain